MIHEKDGLPRDASVRKILANGLIEVSDSSTDKTAVAYDKLMRANVRHY